MHCRQCVLSKKTAAGMSETVTWLPEKFAIKGKVVKLREDADSVWDDGWVVKSVGPQRKESKEVNERSRDYTKNREASDI